jgi:hypothetical protein
MITSGSLISVRFRIVQSYGSEFYLLCGGIGGGRLHEIAKRFSAMQSPRQALLGSGAAACRQHKPEVKAKAAPLKSGTADFFY